MNPIKNINANKFIAEAKDKVTSFELDPLDINLAKIQSNMTKRLEREMAEYGDFAPVVERYESKNPEMNISTVKISCEHDPKSVTKKLRKLNLSVTDKARINEYQCTLKKGYKSDLLEYVNDEEFFSSAKKIVQLINDEIEHNLK